jgi:ribosomal protein S18 acetylase RimI-like enzyme
MIDYRLRTFTDGDAAVVNDLAVAAFEQFRSEYSDWPAMEAGLRRMSTLSEIGEIIVPPAQGRIIGAAAYVPPGRSKAPFFDQSRPIIRMLVVEAAARGNGVGRALTEACINRARRDRSAVIALHTSPIMSIALPMYLRMGFRRVKEALSLYGVPYAVYLKHFSLIEPRGVPNTGDAGGDRTKEPDVWV